MFLSWFKRKKRSSGTPEGVYLSGIDSLTEQDTDRAIQELVRLAKLNPDTAETYLALGNLFRAKGDTERAIQVHRSLIHRSGINRSLKTQAKFNLALDFRKAGFIERAISAFEEVVSGQSDHIPSLEALVELYEEAHDWEKAIVVQEKIAKIKKEDYRHVIAHHLTELGKQLELRDTPNAAIKSYKKAIAKDPNCLDAYLHLGDLLLTQGKPDRAIENWKHVLEIQSELAHLTYPRLERAFRETGREEKFEQFIIDLRRKESLNLYSRLALAKLWVENGSIDRGRAELESILEARPTFWEARLLLGKIIMETDDDQKAIRQYHEIIEMMTPIETNFQCQRCGYEAHELTWKCPRCRAWDTIMLKPVIGSLPGGE